MKNLSVILNIVLLVAVGVLYILYFTGNKHTAESSAVKTEGGVGTKVVYINTDSLFSNYKLSVELNETFLKKQEDRRTELNMKAKDLDREASEFQRKLENGGFVSRERAEAARQEVMDKSQRLQQLQQDMTDQMMREQNDLTKRLFEEISSFLSEYNKEKGYDVVLSTTLAGNVLYAEDGFDITNDVVRRLNENYSKK